MNNIDLKERLAEFMHQIWATWTAHFLANLTSENIERWRRQIATSYAQLTEKEKDSDRDLASRILAEFWSEQQVLKLTLAWMQKHLPWAGQYSADFEADPRPHKHVAHGSQHITKANGQLAAMLDELDHGVPVEEVLKTQNWSRFVADLVVIALRIAIYFPGGGFSLEDAVRTRITEKNKLASEAGTGSSTTPS